jgi:hypothetical protein
MMIGQLTNEKLENLRGNYAEGFEESHENSQPR